MEATGKRRTRKIENENRGKKRQGQGKGRDNREESNETAARASALWRRSSLIKSATLSSFNRAVLNCVHESSRQRMCLVDECACITRGRQAGRLRAVMSLLIDSNH